MQMNTLSISRGPVMVDVAGFVLTEEERVRLSHPLVGGVILFRRNFSSVEQLKALTAEIKTLRTPHLLIAVDHEGGRVQRFLDGFTRLPAMGVLGALWDHDAGVARREAQRAGYVLAAELRACGVDFSFTPVLDVNWGRCAVIGNRSFHPDPEVIAELAMSLQQGLQRGGMPTCGKHFPGHGFVEGDSHHVIPTDNRALDELKKQDILPFAKMISRGLTSVMPAHVVYPVVDSQPAGFSSIWLKDILRGELGFDGVIFSDDLGMEGASGVGGFVERAKSALEAGCDMVLVCNKPERADEVLAGLPMVIDADLERRLARMEGQGETLHWAGLVATADFCGEAGHVAKLATIDMTDGPAVGEVYSN